MMKLIAYAALAGLLAAGCASRNTNGGGTYDATTDSTPGYGTGNTYPGGMNTEPSPAPESTVPDSGGTSTPGTDTTIEPEVNPDTHPDSSAPEVWPETETAPDASDISPNSPDTEEEGTKPGGMEPDESAPGDITPDRTGPEGGASGMIPERSFRRTVLSISI